MELQIHPYEIVYFLSVVIVALFTSRNFLDVCYSRKDLGFCQYWIEITLFLCWVFMPVINTLVAILLLMVPARKA